MFEVVGTATGQKWFSYADDLIFAAIDAGGGFKSVEEVGLELAKTAISAAVGAGMGAASNYLGDLAGNALQGAGKFVNFAAQAGISMTTSYATSVANSAINSFYIGEDGLAFNKSGFVESLYSAETISGAIGAGVTAGLGGINLRDGNNITLNSNTFNVGGIKALNGLAGGLVQNGVSLAMGGNANFNLLSFKGVGMLEFSFGKDGIKSKIGMGGTNISFQNLKAAASGYKEASKVTDWKYGNEQSSSTLNSINMLGYTNSGMNIQLSKDIWSEKLAVEYGNTGNDYGNYTLGDSKIMLSDNLLGGGRAGSAKLASVMSHEGTHYYGNRVEAIAHMSAAETYSQLNQKFKLQADTSFSMEMLAGIMNTDNWKENTGDVDHWTLMDDGSLAYDGKANLYDENGNLIYKTEKTGLEGSLVEILYGKNATAEQIDEVRNLMDKNFSHYTVGDDANNKDNWYWNGKVTEENMGKQISGLTVFGKYGNSIASQAYAHHFDSTVDGLYAFMNGIDIGTTDMKATAFFSMDRFRELYKAKSLFYESAGALFESEDTKISGVYGDYIRDDDGNLLKNYKLSDGSVVDYTYFYKSYKNLHYGIDLIKKSGSDNILLGLSGIVDANKDDEAEGFTLQMNYGYLFDGSFISTGIFGEYGHLKEQSPLQNKTFYSSTQTAGLFGNTGNKTTGAHLHYSVYTKDNIAYSDTTMKILFGKNYQVGSMYNGSWRTVYNPTSFWKKYSIEEQNYEKF